VRFLANYLEDAQNVAVEERFTVAEFRLWLAEQNVTMNLRGDVSRDHIVVSLYSLAEGLAHDWWSIFGSRDRHFSLIRHRTGFAVPDIRFSFDGAAVQISAEQRVYQNPNLRFWAGPSESLPRNEAEAQLGALIENVLKHLKSKRLGNTGAALRWARVLASREDPEEQVFCECAGALGRDPYAVDVSISSLIEDAATTFSDEPLSEFMAGARTFSAANLLQWIRKAESRSVGKSTMYGLADVASKVALEVPARPPEAAWALGYRRARAMRKSLDISQTDRFRSVQVLAKKFGASNSFEAAPRVDGARALRSDHNNTVSIHLRDHGSSSEAESMACFSLARAIGDVACFPEPSKAIVNELHLATRQSAGRAFAAEFLAPIDEVQAMLKDRKDVVTIADEFGVGTILVDHQIENAQRIVEACRG
jgi:hypothetical protein